MIHNNKSKLYEKVVKVYDDNHYVIDLNDVEPETSIICPFDNDMSCTKDKEGNIVIEKKTILSKPFGKQA